MLSARLLARIGGALYLVVAVCGGFSELYVRGNAFVPGDAGATAANVARDADLFRAAFLSDLVAFTCFLGMGVVMYVLLRKVDSRAAVAMLVLNAVSVGIQALNLVGHLGALIVATEPAYRSGLGAPAANATVLLLLELHRHGYLVSEVFSGLFLVPLGYLVYRSGMFPKVLGVVLAIGCAGYLGDVVATYLAPGFQSAAATYFGAAGGVVELAFLLWLLIMGARPGSAARAEGGLAWSA